MRAAYLSSSVGVIAASSAWTLFLWAASEPRCDRRTLRLVEYRDLVIDFAQRTLRNLDHIQELAAAGDETVYDVTQLWNSLLGLIVLPRERQIKLIPVTPMSEVWTRGWPRISVSGPEYEPETLRGFVTALRNAVAHFNVDFGAADGDITSVMVWNEQLDVNRRPIRGSRGWVGRMTIADLDGLARRIANLYVEELAAAA